MTGVIREADTVRAFNSLFMSVRNDFIGGGDAGLAVVNYTPFDDQIPLIRLLHNYSEVVIVAPRRWGKTITFVSAMIDKAANFDFGECLRIYPHRPEAWRPLFAYICPSEGQAYEIAWNYLSQAAVRMGGEASDTKKDGRYRAFLPAIGAMSEIQLLGTQQPKFLRGSYKDGVMGDEFADMSPYVWMTAVQPQLADFRGFEWKSGTPRGTNHFYHAYKAGLKDPNVGVFFIRGSEVGRMVGEYAFLKKKMYAQGDMGVAMYKQEVECDFHAPIPGAFWAKELTRADARGAMGAFPPVPNRPMYVSVDLGVSDPTAMWWFQLAQGGVRWLDYIEETDQSLAFIAKKIAERGIRYGIPYARLFMPHDVKKRDISAIDPDTGKAMDRFTVMQKCLRDEGVSIVVTLVPYAGQLDSIETARPIIDNSVFNTALPEVETAVGALRSFSRKWNEDNQTFERKPAHDWASHAADAFRYGCHMINSHFDKMQEWKGPGDSHSPTANAQGPLHNELGFMFGRESANGICLPTNPIR